MFQQVATAMFLTPGPDNRYILSAWICPGTGSARIGFMQTKDSGQAVLGYDFLTLSADGSVITGGPHLTEGDRLERDTVVLPVSGISSVWQRVYVTFDYTFDPLLASETWVILQNVSPTTASYSVWIDGVQLEKATFPGQTRPTAYSPGKKILFPEPGTWSRRSATLVRVVATAE